MASQVHPIIGSLTSISQPAGVQPLATPAPPPRVLARRIIRAYCLIIVVAFCLVLGATCMQSTETLNEDEPTPQTAIFDATDTKVAVSHK